VPYEPENDPEINQSKVSILEGQMPKKLGFGDGDKSGIIKKPLDVDKSKKNLKTPLAINPKWTSPKNPTKSSVISFLPPERGDIWVLGRAGKDDRVPGINTTVCPNVGCLTYPHKHFTTDISEPSDRIFQDFKETCKEVFMLQLDNIKREKENNITQTTGHTENAKLTHKLCYRSPHGNNFSSQDEIQDLGLTSVKKDKNRLDKTNQDDSVMVGMLNNSIEGDWNEEELGMADPRAKENLPVDNPNNPTMKRMVTTYSIAVTEPNHGVSPKGQGKEPTLGALQAPEPSKSGKSKSPKSGRRDQNRRSQTMSVADLNPMMNSVNSIKRKQSGSNPLKGTKEFSRDALLDKTLPDGISIDKSPGGRSKKLSRQASKLSASPSKKISRQASKLSASPSKKISRQASKLSASPSKKISTPLTIGSGKISGGCSSGVSSDFSHGTALSKNSEKKSGFEKLDGYKKSLGSLNEIKRKISKPISVVGNSKGKNHARSNVKIAISTSPSPVTKGNKLKLKHSSAETIQNGKMKEQMSNAQKETEYSLEYDKDDPLYNLGET
jgi:hypothetical protein